MNIKCIGLAAAALFGAAALAGAASAAPVITVSTIDTPLPTGQMMIDDFDNSIANGFTFSPANVRSGSLGLLSGVSAPPPGDLTNYETVLGGASATLTTPNGLHSISIFLGSPDDYNSITFLGGTVGSLTLSGSGLFFPATAFGGDQTIGRRVSYNFGADTFSSVVFASGGNSFEFDNIAGSVPEPSSWALMMVGVGALGFALRRRPVLAQAAA